MLKIIFKYKKYFIYVPFCLYWLLIFILTTLPGNKLPDAGVNDKLAHILAFFGLGFLLALTINVQNKYKLLKKYSFIFALFIGSFYGLLDELHQYFIPGRFCDINDWISDFIGILLGVGVIEIFKNLNKEFKQLVNNE